MVINLYPYGPRSVPLWLYPYGSCTLMTGYRQDKYSVAALDKGSLAFVPCCTLVAKRLFSFAISANKGVYLMFFFVIMTKKDIWG